MVKHITKNEVTQNWLYKPHWYFRDQGTLVIWMQHTPMNNVILQWNLSITTTQWDTSLPSGAHLGGQEWPRATQMSSRRQKLLVSKSSVDVEAQSNTYSPNIVPGAYSPGNYFREIEHDGVVPIWRRGLKSAGFYILYLRRSLERVGLTSKRYVYKIRSLSLRPAPVYLESIFCVYDKNNSWAFYSH